MIQNYVIQDWRKVAPWRSSKQVEQDLLICRALIEIFSDEYLRGHLAFRGGTALNKLYLSPQPRYSEDIDLVQVNAEPIKGVYDHLRDALAFLGEPKVKQKKHNNTLIFRVQSEDVEPIPIHLKVEINCKEHFSVLPMVNLPFEVDSLWYKGKCEIQTYQLEELAGTKLRALYQRRKGRDLYDLYKILTSKEVDLDKIIECYRKYMGFVVEHVPTYKEFIINLDGKMVEQEFLEDVNVFVPVDDDFDPAGAYDLVRARLIDRLA